MPDTEPAPARRHRYSHHRREGTGQRIAHRGESPGRLRELVARIGSIYRWKGR
jgi:hypothetical protein